MSKKYKATIIERLVLTVQVEADDEIQAEEKVTNLLNKEQIVLTADDFSDREIKIKKEII